MKHSPLLHFQSSTLDSCNGTTQDATDNDIVTQHKTQHRGRQMQHGLHDGLLVLEFLSSRLLTACAHEMDVDDGQESLDVEIELEQESKSVYVGQMIIDMQGKLQSLKIDQMISYEMCAQAIIEHDLPFKFVEFRKIRQWLKYLNLDVIPISRNIAKVDVLKIDMMKKEKLKELIARIPSRISLTFDLWIACTIEGYICLTAHFIDTNWRLNSKILNFCLMPPPHTGHELSKKILEFLIDRGIEKNIFSITLDNASVSDVMCHNLPFGGRATRGSRVCLPRKENAQSRHQRLFEENVRKTGKEKRRRWLPPSLPKRVGLLPPEGTTFFWNPQEGPNIVRSEDPFI
ncbi:putative AC transposase [Glycine soja]|uniref:Putative AC transposase n=1 Tax=Glycine soja TaxID=3848 RepID=A0A445L0B8_GLYSO|nr:putative AC transposase [Glycine soja]